jgi:hypothetical protein
MDLRGRELDGMDWDILAEDMGLVAGCSEREINIRVP